jgi:hypothetical protein
MLLKGGCNDLHTLIKHLLEWILRLKLNTIVFLSYKQMKIAT